MTVRRPLSQTHPKLQTNEGQREMLFQEVVSSSKVEGIKNAETILKKWYKSVGSVKKSLTKDSHHQLKA
jgi:hypothetical protein